MNAAVDFSLFKQNELDHQDRRYGRAKRVAREQASLSNVKVDFRVMDAERLEYEDESFDGMLLRLPLEDFCGESVITLTKR